MSDKIDQLSGPVVAQLSKRLIYIAVAAGIFLLLCTSPLWAVGLLWGDSQPSNANVTAPVYSVPMQAAPAQAQTSVEPEQVGYESAKTAGINCPTNDVIPLYRGGRVVGYSCVVARY